MKFLFYAEKGGHVGLGHVRRCESLSAEFRRRGWAVDYVPDVRVQYDGIVIDSYVLTDEQIREYKKLSPFLIGFHDMGVLNKDFSVIISSVHKEPFIIGKTNILAGQTYRTIHPDILATPVSVVRDHVTSLVVTFGGSPAMALFAEEVATALRKVLTSISVKVVAGLRGKEAASIFSTADIAVAGGGQTMFELAYLGVPTVIVSLGEDQDAQIEDAAEHHFVRVAGKSHDPRVLYTIGELVLAISERKVRQEMHDVARATIDGKGSFRIATAIGQLLGERLPHEKN